MRIQLWHDDQTGVWRWAAYLSSAGVDQLYDTGYAETPVEATQQAVVALTSMGLISGKIPTRRKVN